ncbi:MAG: hypothetical protein ACTTIC_05955 [Helicobacteraceae bacterium]
MKLFGKERASARRAQIKARLHELDMLINSAARLGAKYAMKHYIAQKRERLAELAKL